MIDREKVLQALEHCDLCSDMPNCPGCAYLREPDCMEHLKRDIIALLKAQEPRVMTLEELKSLERDAVVWYEHDGVNKQRPRIVDQVYDSGIIFTDGGHWQFNADAYGKKFRLWTSRPTDEQREAIPWES